MKGEDIHFIKGLGMLNDIRYSNNLAKIVACSKHNKS